MELLKMETVPSSETWVYFYQTTRGHIEEDSILHNHRRENHKRNNGKIIRLLQGQHFSLLESIQPLIQWVWGRGVKLPEREFDHLSPSSLEL
jgi:hypothetical protein